MADFLNTTISGLKSFQRALDVTGHNISSAGTEGYSRQRVELGTREAQAYSNGFVGSGVRVNTVTRAYDGFLVDEQRGATSTHAKSDTYYNLAKQVDNVVADPDAGLSPTLTSFFDATQNLADNPASTEARQVLLSEADSLTDRFHYLDNRLQGLETRLNGDLKNAVDEINSISETIADLNADILQDQGQTGQPPNDLMDKRDQAILDLAEYVDVETVEQADGRINVMIGQGQPLVVGSQSNTLSVSEGQYAGSGHLELNLGGAQVTDYFTGGKVEGMLDFRDEVLDPTRNTLGQTAIGLAEAFNGQHEQGLDLNGELGGQFFSYEELEVFAAGGNSADASADNVSVSVDDPAGLTAQDYTLWYDGSSSSWTLRDSDGATVSMNGSGTSADPYIADGLSIDTSSISSPSDGDKFLIRPTRGGSGTIDTEITDTSKIAAAGPLRAEEATDSFGVPTNSGTGAVSVDGMEGEAFLDAHPELKDGTDPLNLTLTYDGSGGFNASTGLSNWTVSNPASFDSSTGNGSVDVSDGSGNTLTINFTLTGDPADGDEFVVEKNADASGDNRNALALADLQTEGYLNDGNSSAQDNYGRMVADIGIKTRQAEIDVDAQQTRVQQANDAKESVSGVNLDEEAAKLMEYQQAYQAAAKAIRAADEMFQTLLNAV